jgi:hypothetical protein
MYLSLGKQAKRQVSINVLSWRSIAKSLKALSFGLLECDNKNDVIGYVKVLILLMSAFILAGLEGGAK